MDTFLGLHENLRPARAMASRLSVIRQQSGNLKKLSKPFLPTRSELVGIWFSDPSRGQFSDAPSGCGENGIANGGRDDGDTGFAWP